MHVRSATPEDATAIAQVHTESWRAAYRGLMPQAFLDALDVNRQVVFWKQRLVEDRGVVIVAGEAGGVLGFCDLIPSRDSDARPEEIAEIAAIYVQPKHYRRGAGRALCAEAIARAREQGAQTVTLWVLEGNAPARCFYEAMGFRADGGRKTEALSDGTPLTEVRFRIQL